MARILACVALLLPCAAVPQNSPPVVVRADATLRHAQPPRPAETTTRLAAVHVTRRAPLVARPGAKVGGVPRAHLSPRTRPAAASHPRPTPSLLNLGTWRVTKYCWTGNRTASGVWPRIGQAATLDRSIPFGTKLRVIGRTLGGRLIDQVFIVTDRIGHGSQLDLYAGGRGDSGCEPRVNRTWGVQHLRVEVVR